MPVQPTTLAAIVRARAAHADLRVAYRVLAHGEEPAVATSYAELDARAASVAAELDGRGASGGAVLVLCEAGIDYVTALLGCMYSGAVAVPAYAPSRGGFARTGERIAAIVRDSGARWALVTSEVLRHAPELGTVLGVEVIQVDSLPARPFAGAGPDLEARALLQYTSGSTSTPKGVVITHRQLVANLRLGALSGAMDESDVLLSWLPPYHDMGLIGGVLLPLYLGALGVLMPPDAFLRRPRRWLNAATAHRATILMAPNFAFDLCVRRISEQDRAGLDLSSVRLIYDGAEPIDAGVVERFQAAFAPHGLASSAVFPSYGMAETTLIISAGRPGRELVARGFDARALEQHEARREPEPGVPERRLVGCGQALEGERIEIVDPTTLAILPGGRIGEIWVQSPSLASGYHGKPEATASAFGAMTASDEGPFLRTGDLGFFDDGELFISGRLKDLIIVRGRNHYPHDLERTLQAVDPALCTDGGAAFGVDGDSGEELVIVQELDKRQGADASALLVRAADAIRTAHDLTPTAIVLIRRGTLLKTSSGKVRRSAVKDAFAKGELEEVARWPVARPRPALRLVRANEGDESPEPAPEPEPRSARSILRWLREAVATHARIDPALVDDTATLAQYGIDSVASAELAEAAERQLGVEVPSTLPYDHPSVGELARALAARVGLTLLARPAAAATPVVAPTAGHAEEPIAIVGMACRFPGARNLAEYWTLLRCGVDAVTEVPPDRWDAEALYAEEPGVRGKICSRTFGFVEGIDQFDAAFFGISPSEADRMDPQQRMFLELCWEALEHAGIAPTSLAGSLTGVFAGVSTHDYATLLGGALDRVDADYGTGNAAGLVPNRVSYLLDLRGPSEAIDCACASSLVALRHACRSLRTAECDLAIAGGVNAILAPEASIYFSQVGALSKQGRCKSFDESADGFTRGEGAGTLVLKRLSSALADGDTVYALVAGEAVNQSGRTNGLMAPSARAQRDVIERALAAARVAPGDIDYVEAHGVGTKVSDAVEVAALGAVMTGREKETPLRLGTVKTNIGHLEAAAGVAGVIKVALALHHQELPPQLHLRDPHPDLRLDTLPIAIPTVNEPWGRSTRPRLAGVSAFGFGGTNAHVVLREAPVVEAANVSQVSQIRSEHLLPISARTDTALVTMARRLRDRLKDGRDDLADVAYTLGAGRAHFGRRLALRARDAAEARQQLQAYLEGQRPTGLHVCEPTAQARPESAFLFGEPSLRPGYGRELYRAFALCKDVLDHHDEQLRDTLGGSLLEALYGSDIARARQQLARPSFAHAAITAWHHALWALWTRAGVEPVMLFGSGAGEYSAAAAAGGIDWDRAVALAGQRGVVREGLAPGAEQRMSVHELRAALHRESWSVLQVPVVCGSLDLTLSSGQSLDAAHFGRHILHEARAHEGQIPLARSDAALLIAMSTPLGMGSQNASEIASLDPLGADLPRLLDALGALYVRGAALSWIGLDVPSERAKVQLPTYPFERKRHWLEAAPREAPRTRRESQIVPTATSTHPLLSQIRIHVPEGAPEPIGEPDLDGEGHRRGA